MRTKIQTKILLLLLILLLPSHPASHSSLLHASPSPTSPTSPTSPSHTSPSHTSTSPIKKEQSRRITFNRSYDGRITSASKSSPKLIDQQKRKRLILKDKTAKATAKVVGEEGGGVEGVNNTTG
jgi:hypothetical protein